MCLPELEERNDLSLAQGMTDGLRRTLEAAGVRDVRELAAMPVERVARRTHVEPARLRRLARAAEARLAGDALPERPGRIRPLWPAAFVHLLTDPFADRALFIGALVPGPEPAFRSACPGSRDEEWHAVRQLVARLPDGVRLVHYGRELPLWLERHACGHPHQHQREPDRQSPPVAEDERQDIEDGDGAGHGHEDSRARRPPSMP